MAVVSLPVIMMGVAIIVMVIVCVAYVVMH